MARLLTVLIILLVLLTSCSKEEGEGGTSVITGKVMVQLYNNGVYTGTDYYAPEEDVYIIYGNDDIYSDRFRTSFDGSYWFKYLRQGNYTIFAYSEDPTGTVPSGVIVVQKSVKITENDQHVTVEDIVIIKDD